MVVMEVPEVAPLDRTAWPMAVQTTERVVRRQLVGQVVWRLITWMPKMVHTLVEVMVLKRATSDSL